MKTKIPITNISEKLALNVIETNFEDIDKENVDNAKNRIIEVVGCAIGGANASGNKALVNLVNRWGGKKEATILVHNCKAPAHNVAMVNSIMARSYDFEVVSVLFDNLGIPSHISGTTVMTALAVGEMKKINGKAFITALILGDDVASRILAGCGFSFGSGWDVAGILNSFGAAAVTGKLLGLNKDQMVNAFAFALNQLSGSMQSTWDKTTDFKLQQGTSARNGVTAAELAEIGWVGPKEPLLGKYGYYKLFSNQGCLNPYALSKDLGKRFYGEATFKPYPGCRMNHLAIDCALEIVSKHNIVAENIEEIVLKVPFMITNTFVARNFNVNDLDFPQAGALFSLRYSVANVLLRKSIKLEHFNETFIKDPMIARLSDRMKILGVPGTDVNEVMTEDLLGPFTLIVKMKDGNEYTTSLKYPTGDPNHKPRTAEEIISKFINNAAFSEIVTIENAEKALNMINNIENIKNIEELVALLV